MNVHNRLDQFRSDNPYDPETQAKRLLVANDKELILHVLALGFAAAKQRQRHFERDYIKTVGRTPERERLIPGPVTGAVKIAPIAPSKQAKNAMRQLIVDMWRINGEQKLGDANANDLTAAIKRENMSANGHSRNAEFYGTLKDKLDPKGTETVRMKCDEASVRTTIEKVYGEFRKTEAA